MEVFHKNFPCLDFRISGVCSCFGSGIEGVVYFDDHEEAVAGAEDFHIDDSCVADAGGDGGRDLARSVVSFVGGDEVGIVFEIESEVEALVHKIGLIFFEDQSYLN